MRNQTRIHFRPARAAAIFGMLILIFAAGCNLPTAASPTPSAPPAPTAAPSTATAAPTLAPAVEAPSPTLIPTDTSVPTAPDPVAVRDALCYGGPGRVYGVISAIQGGSSVVLLGRGNLYDWWIVQNPIYDVPCWIAATDLQIDAAYDTSALEVATPPPFPANLVAGKVVLDPSPPTCAEQFTVGIDVTNKGSQPTISKGTVSAVDRRDSDGSQQASGTGTFPTLDPGETYRVNISLTVSKWYNEKHVISLFVDSDTVIPEFDESDNKTSVSYTLQQGSCP